MKKLRVGVLTLAAATLFLSGCSSDTAATSPPENDQGDQAAVTQESAAESTEAAESLGAVRINDATTYAITELRNCEPLDDGTIERELELQGFGDHQGERIQVDVHIQTIAGVANHDVSWSGPEGVFGNSGDARVTWGPDNGSVLGSATLVDAMTQTDKIRLDFDLQVPSETVACR